MVFPTLPSETLSPTRTVGHGRTNLTFIAPTIVQVDAATPYAGFDKRNQARNPAIQAHFEPSAYGIVATGTFLMEFVVDVPVQSTFNLVGYAGSGSVANAGTKVLLPDLVVNA